MTTVALAGRRIDADDGAVPRFPLANRSIVADRITSYLRAHDVKLLVCSAACGADLIALEAAEGLGIARWIVLPFDVATFREMSVTDRPGEWGGLYDRLVAAAEEEGRLHCLGLEAGGEAPYAAATDRIIAEAAEGSGPHRACIVWEGAARSEDDHTMGLAEVARERGWLVDQISTRLQSEDPREIEKRNS